MININQSEPLRFAVGASDEAWRKAVRAVMAEMARRVEHDFDTGADIEILLATRATEVDRVVVSAWQRCAGNNEAALIATGGYGRGELFPYSDIDLLVLAGEDQQVRLQPALQAFFAGLWDVGLAPGHAVRSVAQCLEIARVDAAVLTALMEARWLGGGKDPFNSLQQAIAAPDLYPPAEYLTAKREEQAQRHARFDDTAYNLEPNLKEGPGGLRDLHTLRWIGKRLFGARSFADWMALDLLGKDEQETLQQAYRLLSRWRCGLHLLARRREERLLFDYQTALARRFGFCDRPGEALAVEQWMQEFFRTAATVLRLNARLLQRCEEKLSGECPVALALDEEFIVRRGYLAARDPTLFARDPHAILRLFKVWQSHPDIRGLHSETERHLGAALPAIDEEFRADPAVHEIFLEILRGARAVDMLAAMAKCGVLGRYLPPFGRVAGRMQYDLFHVYTVDEHTLAVLRNIAGFQDISSTGRFALAYELWPHLRKPELLLLAALFHDIAKGRGGDHSDLGAEEAREFCQRHDLSSGDTGLVVWLVREHLLMSITAQREDISDPEVVARFARRVGERERLDYLYLLTVADIAGTSPKLWNAWKDRLLADLHNATRFALRQGLERRVHAAERIAETRAAVYAMLAEKGFERARIERLCAELPDESFLRYRAEQIAWQISGIASAVPPHGPLVLVRPHARSGTLEIFVYTPDRDGLFAAVTATLDRLGLSIMEARIVTSRRGMSLDTFQVLDSELDPNAEARLASVVHALDRVLAEVPYRVAPARRAVPRQLRHFRVSPRIIFSSQPVFGRTEITLVCSDRPGLLAQVAATLREHRLRVHDARIATFGERVEDFFLVADENDQPLSDPKQLQSVRAALAACIDVAYGENKKLGASGG